MDTNLVTELPSQWLSGINKLDASIYIKFVDDKVNWAESKDPKNYLQLHILTSYIYENMIIESLTWSLKTALIPKDNGDMFVFPFNLKGQRVDSIALDLLLMGSPHFCFKDDSSFLRKINKDSTDYPS